MLPGGWMLLIPPRVIGPINRGAVAIGRAALQPEMAGLVLPDAHGVTVELLAAMEAPLRVSCPAAHGADIAARCPYHANRFVPLKSCTNVLSFSGSTARRKRVTDQLVELVIDRAQGLPEFAGQGRWRSVHGGEGGGEDPRLPKGIQSGQFPAVGGEVVALAGEGPPQEAFLHH